MSLDLCISSNLSRALSLGQQLDLQSQNVPLLCMVHDMWLHGQHDADHTNRRFLASTQTSILYATTSKPANLLTRQVSQGRKKRSTSINLLRPSFRQCLAPRGYCAEASLALIRCYLDAALIPVVKIVQRHAVGSGGHLFYKRLLLSWPVTECGSNILPSYDSGYWPICAVPIQLRISVRLVEKHTDCRIGHLSIHSKDIVKNDQCMPHQVNRAS